MRTRLLGHTLPLEIPAGQMSLPVPPSGWELGRDIRLANVDLGSGLRMPLLGFGTMKHANAELYEAVRFAAAELGYRHFDCAQAYQNEDMIGQALRASGVARKDLFIANKISQTQDYGSEA